MNIDNPLILNRVISEANLTHARNILGSGINKGSKGLNYIWKYISNLVINDVDTFMYGCMRRTRIMSISSGCL